MDQEIEFRHLRAFVAVGEHLHFGRAAQQLHLAQPALSQRSAGWKICWGALFLRTSRSVALTAAGEVLLQRARHMLQSLHSDVQEVRNVA